MQAWNGINSIVRHPAQTQSVRHETQTVGQPTMPASELRPAAPNPEQDTEPRVIARQASPISELSQRSPVWEAEAESESEPILRHVAPISELRLVSEISELESEQEPESDWEELELEMAACESVSREEEEEEEVVNDPAAVLSCHHVMGVLK